MVLVADEVWQECRNLGKEHDDNSQNDEGIQKGEDPFENRIERYIRCNALDHKDIDPDRRCDDAHLTHQGDHDPEPDGVKPERLNNRIENGDGYHNEAHGVHKEAAHKIDKNNDAHDSHFVNGKVSHPIGQLEGNG